MLIFQDFHSGATPMLNVMRENLRHLKWLLWLVAVSMVLYLGALFSCEQPGGPSDAWVAKVNGVEIPTTRFLSTARNIDQYYRQLFGSNYQNVKQQMHIGNQALQTLLEQELIRQDAHRLGLVVSKTDLAERIRTDPNLQDANGQFIGNEEYVRLVGRGYTGGVTAFERAIEEEILANKWNDLVTQGIAIGEADLEKLHRQRTETTAIRYVVVPSAGRSFETEISDDQAREWYDAHLDSYERGEGRRIRFIVIDREAQQAQVVITEEEILASYEANEASYSHPEQRQARHILFRIEPQASDDEKAALRQEAEDALQRLNNGEDFAELARTLSQDPGSAPGGGDLGFFSRGDMVAAFDEAAFGTPVGELAPIVETEFGFHVIQVTDSRVAGVTPLDDVRDGIRRSLEVRRAQELVASESERLGQTLQAAEQLEAVAQTEGLEIRELFITEGDRLAELGAAPDFTSTVFGTDVGSVSPPLRVARGMALVAVDEVIPPAVAPFEEVENSVRTDILNQRAKDAALAEARRAFDAGGDLDTAAAALKVDVQDSGDLTRGQSLPSTGESPQTVEALLFGDSVAVGDRDVIEVAAGAMIYEVTGRELFDPAAYQVAKPDLRRELLTRRQGLVQRSILERLRESQDVKVNQTLVDRYKG
jgi:peptidyl-prolyl cis-trans isomerase D